MKQVVIENPIVNSPFEEPKRHFRFDEEGITSEIVEKRRNSQYFIPIAKPKKKDKQLQLELEPWQSDRIEENSFINDIRISVSLWRNGNYSSTVNITPITVESLSPHRVLSTNEERPANEAEGIQQASDNFEIRIIENLKKAGVQNGKKDERLKFEYLEPYPGTWIQAEGEYIDKDGTTHRVAVSIGSEYGTVGSDQIKESAKEARKGLGYDLLIVCGFAFYPGVSEESKRYGKLQILALFKNGGFWVTNAA